MEVFDLTSILHFVKFCTSSYVHEEKLRQFVSCMRSIDKTGVFSSALTITGTFC